MRSSVQARLRYCKPKRHDGGSHEQTERRSTRTNLAPDARAFLDALNSGPRGKIGLIGPFGVWAHAPKIGQAAQAFGGAVRFQTTLPERIKEIAICTVGAHYKAKFEFAAHGPMAIAAGVPAAAVEAIRLGADPNFADPADRASYRVARELLLEHRLSDATFKDAKESLR